MNLKGIVHKYDKDNIDTDVILPGPYLKIHDHVELSKHAMEGIDNDFSKKYSRVISFWRGITLDVDQAENMLQ